MAPGNEQSLKVSTVSFDGQSTTLLVAEAYVDSGVPNSTASKPIRESVFSICSECPHYIRNIYTYTHVDSNRQYVSSPELRALDKEKSHPCNPAVAVSIGIPEEGGVVRKRVNIFVSSHVPSVDLVNRRFIHTQGGPIIRSNQEIEDLSSALHDVRYTIPPTCPLIDEGIKFLQVDFHQDPVSPSNTPTTA